MSGRCAASSSLRVPHFGLLWRTASCAMDARSGRAVLLCPSGTVTGLRARVVSESDGGLAMKLVLQRKSFLLSLLTLAGCSGSGAVVATTPTNRPLQLSLFPLPTAGSDPTA